MFSGFMDVFPKLEWRVGNLAAKAVAFLPQSINYTTALTEDSLMRAMGCAIISVGHRSC